jgi:FkbM family methyltransferase
MNLKRACGRLVRSTLSRLGYHLLRDADLLATELLLLRSRSECISRRGYIEILLAAARHGGAHPPKVADFIDFCARHYALSNSADGQDLFVLYATGLRRGGTFLEIGGADGITQSNTLSLAQHFGWKGALVEPDQGQFRLLAAARPGDRTLRCAISPDGAEGTLELVTVGQLSCLAGHEPVDQHSAARQQHTERQTVRTVNINRILEELGPVTYFSLDVEGMELAILRQVEWRKVTPPLCLTIEHNHDLERKRAILELLVPLGYRELFPEQEWLSRGDLWLVHGPSAPAVQARS